VKSIRLFSILVFLFSFQCVNALDYYWVGTVSSDWYTTQNWLESGSTPGAPPGPGDNVFFNASSFPTTGLSVNISNVSTARCRNMSWVGATNNPAFTGNGPLFVSGSMTLIPGMTWTLSGDLTFDIGLIAMPSRTITTSGVQINSRMIYNASGVTWSLAGVLNSSRGIDVNDGSFVTNNWDVNASNFNSGTTSIRTINFGSSTLTLSDAGGGVYNLNATNLTFIGGSSTINITHRVSPIVSVGTGLAYNNINFTATGTNTSGQLSGNNCTFNNVTVANAGGNISISTSNCTFNSVVLGRNASIGGNNNVFQNLTFTSGKRYTFQSAQSQTIHNLIANGACASGSTEIYSSTVGSVANIVKQSGALTLTKIVLRDIGISGPTGPFTINDVVDLGGNSGWTLNPYSPPAALYWVKVAGSGTGNWSDAAHWSTSSNGPGGACVPTALDNVVFDGNSFGLAGEIVTIDNNAHCNNMTWTGVNSPAFSGSGMFDLDIYGSLVFHASMNTNNLGVNVNFRATTIGKTITSAGKRFMNTVWFHGIGGWTFLDAFECAGNFYFENGNLNTNGQNVMVANFRSLPSTTRTLSITSSTITVTSGTWNVNGTNFTLNALNSLIKFINSGNLSTTPGKAYYDIEFTHPTNTGSVLNSAGSFNNVTFFGHGNLNANQTFNVLTFSPGKNYVLQAGQTQTVNTTFNITGTCSGYISIASTSAAPATINKPSGGVVGDYCIVQNITAGGPVFVANNSIGLGTNTNWTIPATASRNLYWVPVAGSGTGNWSDQNHWSLTSGGAGGACLPTLNDDVFFDVNSFTSSPAAQTVTIDQDAICHNMNWSGSLYTPTFAGNSPNRMRIFGSLTFIAAMNLNYNCDTYFEATATGNTITMATRSFRTDVRFIGVGGGWIFQDAFSVNSSDDIIHEWGDINTNNQAVLATSFQTNSGNTRSITFGSSVITLRYRWNSSAAGLTLNAGTSKFIMDGTYATPTFNHTGANLNFYDVNFTHPSSVSRISSSTAGFHNVFFIHDGLINGANTFSKLTFSPGKTYTLGSNQTQIVDTLIARGNPCYIITLRSNTAATQARISKASGSVLGDYLNIKDIMGTGGASFFAGQYSIDAGNNTGWTFNNAPGYIFGLGRDTAFQSCGTPITLTTVNFNGVAATTYTWNTGSTASSLNVSNPGTYWVTANYGSGCIYIDSIRITVNPLLLNLQVSPDNSICQGGSSLLTASGGTSYTWGPSAGLSSTTGSSVTATPNITTSYTVTAVNGICNDNRIITITVTPVPTLTISSAITICLGSSALLTASGANSYTWSPAVGLSATTGASVNASPTINTSYTISGTNGGGCSDIRVITVSVVPTPTITLSPSTTICRGSSTILTAGGAASYSWAPSSGLSATTGASVNASPTTTTTYTVTGINGNCTNNSIVTVTVISTPTLTVSSGSSICRGSSMLLTTGGATTYSWFPSIGLSATTGSSVTANPTASTTYTINGTSGGCTASATIYLAVNVASASSHTYTSCGSYTHGAQTYTATGVYTQTLTNASGCDSIRTLNLTINNPVSTSGVQTICSGSTIIIHGVNRSVAGIYSQTFVASNGCDSISDITLMVNAVNSNTLTVGACNSYIHGPQTYTITGVYTQTLTNALGCDSILTINLTINNTITTSGTQTICSGASAIIHGVSQNIAGVYSQTYTAVGGCDSISDITLIVNSISTSTTSVVTCNSYTHGAQTYIVTGVYTQTLTNASGCDSILTLNVTINNAVSTSGTQTICSGSIANIHGINQSVAGIYSQTFVAANGCDSISDITLVVNPISANTITAATCNNYTHGAQTYTITGVYTQTLTNATGCDSILTINLTINNTITTSGTQTICSGASAAIHGISQSVAGVYSQTYIAVGGCDSISDITLIVNPLSTNTIVVAACNSYTHNLQAYLATGVFTQTLTNASGCDSILTIDLTINNTAIISSTQTICSGSFAIIHGINQNIAGIYSQTFVAASGCDSISSITLIVNNPSIYSMTVNACDSYVLNAQTYTVTGVYTQTLINSIGCDSIITLDLTINYSSSIASVVTICSGETATVHGIAQNTAGIYSQTFTSVGGCDSVSNVTLVVNDLPVVSFVSDVSSGCESLCVNFNNTTANANSVVWSFGDGNTSSNAMPQYCYINDGLYNVTLVVTDNNGCKDSLTNTNMITVYPNPVSQFVASPYETTIVTPEITFTDQSIGATIWSWSFGDALYGTSSSQNISYAYSDSGSYIVKQVVINGFGCKDSSEQHIKIKADYVFYVPNTFTPNNDGLNDEFIPYSIGLDVSRDYQLSVYDRWGNLIFRTNDPNKGWNARKNNTGDEVAQDTYLWMISTRDIFGKGHAYDGRVNVIR